MTNEEEDGHEDYPSKADNKVIPILSNKVPNYMKRDIMTFKPSSSRENSGNNKGRNREEKLSIL